MTRREAERLADRIEREDPAVRVTGFRAVEDEGEGLRPSLITSKVPLYVIDCVDTRTGSTFLVTSPGAWTRRLAERGRET